MEAKVPAEGKPGGKRVATGRPFVKDDPRIAHNMRKARGAEGESAEESVSFQDLDPGEVLEAMKHVLTRPKGMDKTELQKLVRAAKEEKPFSFLQEYQKRRDVGKDKEVKDDGTAVAVELVERLLAEFEGKQQ